MNLVSSIDQKKKPGILPSASVSAFFLKQIYASMLHNMEASQVRSFWNSQWESAKELFPNKTDFYFRLWQAQTRFDFRTVVKFSKNLESIATRQNIDIARLIDDAFHFGRNLTESARFFLHHSAPILQDLLTADDSRKQLLYYVRHLTEKFSSGIHNLLLDHTTRDNLHETRFLLSYPQDDCCCGFNSELWIVLVIKYLPTLFSLDPYENHYMLCDCRSVSEIIPSARIFNNLLIINENIYGRTTHFYGFCKKKSILFKVLKQRIPDSPCIEVHKDFSCPRTGRIILHKGCIYGAPVSIYGFRYKSQKTNTIHGLESFIETATAETSTLDKEVNHKHLLLMKTIGTKAQVTYFKADESISVNGNHLVKSVPAKIIRYIIKSYLQFGKTRYEYKDFSKKSDIIFDSNNPNIAIRLKRLSTVLEKSFPQLNIIMNGRGKFRIEVNCKLEYTEE
ncbi:MAG: hypothetical protein ACLFVE_11850 [Chitinispirillaceae bacterium]